MPQWWKQSDPQTKTEEGKYNEPVPSRDFILQYLSERESPARHDQLCQEFEIEEASQIEALRRRLIAMSRDGQLHQNRKRQFGILDKMDLITGKVQAAKDGYGFVIPEQPGEDFFLTARQMRTLMDGDRVVIQKTDENYRGRQYCAIIEVIERGVTQLVGKYFEEKDAGFIKPENRKILHDIWIEPGALTPKEGQLVLVDITKYPQQHQMATGVVREVLGNSHDAGIEVKIALKTHNIPSSWPEELQKQLNKIPDEVASKDKKERFDLRHLPLVTIDGEDARDFDDAVYCERKKGGGWRLFVAIADVSHYVKAGSELDIEAENRGTSVYFPDHVIPMLPEALSNGICSLNPSVDRLAMVCEMTISAKGKISGYSFYEGLINSHARLTYTQVSNILENADASEGLADRETFAAVVPHLEVLYQLYGALRHERETRGAIDFDTVETRIIFGKHRKIKDIVPTTRNEAHRIIEECMLCANVSTARFLEKHELPILYRVHDVPGDEKLETLSSFLGERGLKLPGRKKPTPKDYQSLMQIIQNRPDFTTVQTMLLRSLSQAIYHHDNIGHFGLAYKHYAHFTSPIRRYPDLLVHRAIRHVIRSDQSSKFVKRHEQAKPIAKKSIFPYDAEKMEKLGEHCSAVERRADEATRSAIDWLKCEYMQKHIGSIYQGAVVAVTGFGLFVELTDVYVSGLIHISSLPDDYYHFDAPKQRLIGEHTRRAFQLGDKVEIRVLRVNLDDKKIDFELTEKPAQPIKHSKKSRVSLDMPKGRRSKSSKDLGGRDKAKNKRKPSRKKVAKKGEVATGVVPVTKEITAPGQPKKNKDVKKGKKKTKNTTAASGKKDGKKKAPRKRSKANKKSKTVGVNPA